MKKNDYRDAKLAQIQAATTARLYGRFLPQGDLSASSAESAASWRPFQVCFCVQDSPDSPCLCRARIVWVSEIAGSGRAERKDHDGNQLEFVDVAHDSIILAEQLTPVRASAFRGSPTVLDRERSNLASALDDPAAGTIAMEVPLWLVEVAREVALKAVINDLLSAIIKAVPKPK